MDKISKGKKKFNTIDEYIASFSSDIQEILHKIRNTIHLVVPNVEETISYQIPTFRLKKNLVHFAAFKKHIGFFPTSSGITAFKDEISKYKSSKGSIQFPLNKPIPYELIKKITQYRVQEISGKLD